MQQHKHLIAVRAGFTRLGTSLRAYCIENEIDQSNASKALRNEWKGEKATALKKRLLEASTAQAITTAEM